ncbi:VanZ family protein [Anaerolineales bacterium HSG6]|nr:VanZ family protein [Anaerolineales bacterium HSG6]MDM8532301.1 VanZ family protein [Anaerolineales bacterium HSG25]
MRHNRPSRWLIDIAPLMIWMGFIFLLSSRSRLVQFDEPLLATLFFKSAHVGVYAVLLWLWWRAISPQREIKPKVLGLALFLTVLYGISDEIHQSYVPGRTAHLADVCFDTAGALIMIIAIRWLKQNQVADKIGSRFYSA